MRAKGLAKFVCNNEVLLYQGSFSYMYCYYWGNQNSLLYQGLHYIEVHYIKVPLYNETSLWTNFASPLAFHYIEVPLYLSEQGCPSRQQNWGVVGRTTQYWDKMDCLNAIKKDCLRIWKETKSLVMWRQLKKSAKISGVEFEKKKWSTMQRLNACKVLKMS